MPYNTIDDLPESSSYAYAELTANYEQEVASGRASPLGQIELGASQVATITSTSVRPMHIGALVGTDQKIRLALFSKERTERGPILVSFLLGSLERRRADHDRVLARISSLSSSEALDNEWTGMVIAQMITHSIERDELANEVKQKMASLLPG